MKQSESARAALVRKAITHEHKSNRNVWVTCNMALRVMGNYGESGVKGLAADLGKEDDTIYDRAHAQEIFEKMITFRDGKFRLFVFQARRSPFIYWSHFRALWDAWKTYNLSMDAVIDLLMDIVQAEGGISTRNVDVHVRGKYGVDRPWEWYANKAINAIQKAIVHPDTPKGISKDLRNIYKKLGGK